MRSKGKKIAFERGPALRGGRGTRKEAVMIGAAVITASDRSSRGRAGRCQWAGACSPARADPGAARDLRVVPDTVRDIRGALRVLLKNPEVKLILTTGGTG